MSPDIPILSRNLRPLRSASLALAFGCFLGLLVIHPGPPGIANDTSDIRTGPIPAEPDDPHTVTDPETPEANAKDDGIDVSNWQIHDQIHGGNGPSNGRGQPRRTPPPPPTHILSWEDVDNSGDCAPSLAGEWSCAPLPGSCEEFSAPPLRGIGDALYIEQASQSRTDAAPQEGRTQTGTRTEIATGNSESLGTRCFNPETGQMQPGLPGAAPVVITVTQSDFARMPVNSLEANAGPPDGWLPVGMVNVLYTTPETQDLEVELLDTPVAVRATPVSYHWDLGDGNTLETTNPGKPYPSEEVTATYAREGWYDITLTTTFTGQFSVDGGEWQDIEGTIEVESDPVEIYSKSLESRLVNGDVPVDEDKDPWMPPRTPDTEGEQDPDANHRTT